MQGGLTKNFFVLLIAVLAPFIARADIVCQGKGRLTGQLYAVHVGENGVVVTSDALPGGIKYRDLSRTESGLNNTIAAQGFNLTYQNHYGYVADAVATFRLSEGISENIRANLCRGGVTTDRWCLAHAQVEEKQFVESGMTDVSVPVSQTVALMKSNA